jgi:hypothetical protein
MRHEIYIKEKEEKTKKSSVKKKPGLPVYRGKKKPSKNAWNWIITTI